MYVNGKLNLLRSGLLLMILFLLPFQPHAKPTEHEMAFVDALRKNDCDTVKSLLQQK